MYDALGRIHSDIGPLTRKPRWGHLQISLTFATMQWDVIQQGAALANQTEARTRSC